MQKIALGVALALAAGAATADVTYRWETIDPKLTTVPIVGRVVLSDAAYRSGAVNFVNIPCVGAGTCPDPENPGNPNSPVRSLTYYMTGYQGLGVNLDYVLTDGDNGDGQDSGVKALAGNALRGGHIYNSGSESYFSMTSDASGLWTVDDAISLESGEGELCWKGMLCGGETGRWVLDRSTIPVPEPSTLLLAALGVAGLITRRRMCA